jgi:glyoxylase I family protein
MCGLGSIWYLPKVRAGAGSIPDSCFASSSIWAIMFPAFTYASILPAMFHIREIDHLVLRVVDVERMLRFYCDALGCTVERRVDTGLIQLRAGRSLIDLVLVDSEMGKIGGAAPGKEGRNLEHFCLRIEPFDETALRCQLAEHGVEVGTVKARYGAEGFGPSVYVTDPEGNVVELKGPPA